MDKKFLAFREKFKEFSEECEAELGIKLNIGTIRYTDNYNFTAKIEAIPAYKSSEQAFFDTEVDKGILKIVKPIECGITNINIRGENYIFLGAKKGKYHPYPVLLRPDSKVIYIRTWRNLSEYVRCPSEEVGK